MTKPRWAPIRPRPGHSLARIPWASHCLNFGHVDLYSLALGLRQRLNATENDDRGETQHVKSSYLRTAIYIIPGARACFPRVRQVPKNVRAPAAFVGDPRIMTSMPRTDHQGSFSPPRRRREVLPQSRMLVIGKTGETIDLPWDNAATSGIMALSARGKHKKITDPNDSHSGKGTHPPKAKRRCVCGD